MAGIDQLAGLQGVMDNVRIGGASPAPTSEHDAAAADFEGMLLRELVKSMRATIPKGDDMTGQAMFDHLIEGALADHVAHSGGIGLRGLFTGAPGAPARGDAMPIAIEGGGVAADAGEVDAPARQGLAAMLPPDQDAWLTRDDAVDALDRVLRTGALMAGQDALSGEVDEL